MYESPNPNGNAGVAAGAARGATSRASGRSGTRSASRSNGGRSASSAGTLKGSRADGLTVAEEHVGETGPGLAAAVPGLDDGGDVVDPLGDDDGAAGLDDDDGARVGGGDGADERDVGVGQAQRCCGRRRR